MRGFFPLKHHLGLVPHVKTAKLTSRCAGGGKGSWSAWKAGEMSRRYEQKGGNYEDTGDNKNKAQKGTPEKK